MSDPRFARLHTDPRFVRQKASKNKIVVDDRFKQLFQDQDAAKEGKGKRKVDKYGRPLEQESEVNDLKRYYRMASPDAQAMKDGTAAQEDDDEDEDGSDDDDEENDEPAPAGKSFMDLARGEVLLESSDEEDEPEQDDEEAGNESDSSSAAGSVALGPSHRRRRQPSRSPSIDLSETERPLFPDEDDEDVQASQDEDDVPDVDPTKRVALVNMDWDNLRASDLYRVLASSLSATATSVQHAPQPKPSGSSTKFDQEGNEVGPYKPTAKLSIAPGRLLNLRIYPSSFGRERMEREAIEGPPVDVLRTKGAESDDEDEGGNGTLKLGKKNKGKAKERRRRADADDDDEDYTEKDLVNDQLQENDEDYDTEALRKYQLERLRYYYAIATFNTVSAAAHVVKEINGTEFERTANVFDLQFVPDETSFEDDPIHEEATEASIAAEGNSYQGIDFSTDALRHSKVKLTWDADDPHRKTKLQTYLAAALDKSKQKGATKGRPNVGDADIAQYLASSSDEENESGAENAEEQDDFFEAAEEEDVKSKKDQKRNKLRNLFGLDGGDAGGEQSWDGGAKSGKGGKGGMQITFAPALSERSAKQLDLVEGDKPETAIETYRRKEKERKERKKAERKAKAEGRDFDEEGPFGDAPEGEDKGFDDDFFADDGGKDPFATYDEGNASSGDEIGLGKNKQDKKKKLSKKDKKAQREAEELALEAEKSELALLVGSDDEDDVLGGGGEGGRHFDMRKILKAEKAKGKKVKAKGKKAKQADAPVQDDFKLDLTDDRFKNLHDDFDFAIDPSNPKFQKTRNMDALLAEGRKRRAKRSEARAPVNATEIARKKAATSAGDGDSLNKLIESVKRKAGETGGRGKRSKTE
ncbi:pre-rRNA-processing protein ESF1 [Sporobolomyces koalae]|uniref:pre-rRNA-processing protein ESF1 n=1 Tax=Sporobolomyces koalae TaxID=500713 RepID=UPI00317B07B4